ncbi:hypothetical protein C8T65DRAFT_167893 [Cerioporus squamosus]|nr:hypothetical protein C8T65DRAFT_167893 [Cerioporus squamosus]
MQMQVAIVEERRCRCQIPSRILIQAGSLRVLSPQGLLAHPYSANGMMVRHRGHGRGERKRTKTQIQMQIQRCVPVPYEGRTNAYRGWSPHARSFPPVLPCIMTCWWEGGRDRPARRETHGRKFVTWLPSSLLRPCALLHAPAVQIARRSCHGLRTRGGPRGLFWANLGRNPGRERGEGQGPMGFLPRRTRSVVANAFSRSLCI